MSEEVCIGSPFQFLVARVIAGGWLCCEDEAAGRHFSVPPNIFRVTESFPPAAGDVC